ncbi:MAG: hypothetical protein WB421_08015 [Terriglobales bacterium]
MTFPGESISSNEKRKNCMQNYDLNRLGDKDFETLIQTLLKKVIGPGTTTFGAGPDGAREATFKGRAPYPSITEQWGGNWIFQAKFHDVTRIGPDKARQAVLKDLRAELDKVVNKYKTPCDNYILATNVPLSSVPVRGTHDQIASAIVPEFVEHIPHIHVWGYDDIARFLELHSEVREPYLHLLTPGDVIAELMAESTARKAELTTIVQLYLRTSFDNEQYAQLDQAGEVDSKHLQLRSIFIDLNVRARSERDVRVFINDHPECAELYQFSRTEQSFSACKSLLGINVKRSVLIGGPGQGKSTLCQFITQIHRAYLLNRRQEAAWSDRSFTPLQVRLPFKVILKDYAQWISGTTDGGTLESFIAFNVHERTARSVTPEQIQELIKLNPALLILDGLDEVNDRDLRRRMLRQVSDFIVRSEVLESDLQIICTSRPTGYTDQFDPAQFMHLTLSTLGREKILEYTTKWAEAKQLDVQKSRSLLSSITDCLEDPNFSSLMNTPLQVTIFILIILSGGTPPRQREELFNEYLEIIYKRERSKSKTIIQTEKRLLFGLHQFLGYLLHRRAAVADTRSRMSESELRTAVMQYLRHDDPFSEVNDLKAKADQITQEAHERLVLLVQPEDGFFGFELRSIQEFFAAGYLVDTAGDNIQRFERFQAVSIPPHWRNVALFFAGRVGRLNRGESAHILETCREIDRYKPDFFIRRGAWLALDIAVDRSFGPARPLQRSALEIALGLLDGDFSPERRIELQIKLRQLPAEDIQQHVLPMLEERLQRSRLEDGFAVLDVYSALKGTKQRLEDVFRREIPQTTIPLYILVRKALSYHLDPRFISTSLGIDSSENAIFFELAASFAEDPEYVASVLKHSSIDGKVALEICLTAAEKYSYVYMPSLPELSLPKSEYDQAVLAYRLFTSAARLDHYARHLNRTTLSDITSDQIEAVVQIAADPISTPELRAAAWAFSIRVIVFRGDEAVLGKIAKAFNDLSAKAMARVENALRRTESPSLDILTTAGEQWQSILRGSNMRPSLQDMRQSMVVRGAADYIEILAWVFLSIDVGVTVRLLETLKPKRVRKKISGESLQELVIRRLAFKTGQFFWSKDPHLLVKTIPPALNLVINVLESGDAEGWSALQRLAAFKWSGEVNRGLLQSLRNLCITLEKMPGVILALPLATFIAKVAEIKGTERYVVWMMKILRKAADGADREAPRRLREIRKTTITRMAKLATDRDSLAGFARWLAWLDTSLQPRNAGDFMVELPRLRMDKKRARDLVDAESGDIKTGAVLILANTLATTYDEAKQLLRLADDDVAQSCWAELIEGTVKDVDDSNAIDFLEEIVSVASSYPKVVKYAALNKYEQVARSSTIDILQQEAQLGLPLQDVLRLKRDKVEIAALPEKDR